MNHLGRRAAGLRPSRALVVLAGLAMAVLLLVPGAATAMDCSPYGGEGMRQLGFKSCIPGGCAPEVAVYFCDCYGNCSVTGEDPASLMPYNYRGCCEYLPCAPGHACDAGQPGCEGGVCKLVDDDDRGLQTSCGEVGSSCIGPDPTWLGPYAAACFPPDETCDGEDNDCDGNIDNVPGSTTPIQQACYSGPAETRGVGACKDGAESCVNGQWGVCEGSILPTSEACDGRDNDCNRKADESLPGCNQNEPDSCHPVGGASQVGDPTSLGGATFHRRQDVRIRGSVETFVLERSFASDPGTWRYGGSFTPDELFVPRPFGANDATGTSLAWTHDLYAFVHVLGWGFGASWNVRMPGGAFVSFAACSDVDGATECFASPTAEFRESPYRLHWDGSDVFTLFTGKRRYRFDAQDLRAEPDPTTRPGTRFFLSAVEVAPEMDPWGQPKRLLSLSYSAPEDDCLSVEHLDAPYLESVTTEDGAELRFSYVELPSRVPSRDECVLRAIHIVDDPDPWSLPPSTRLLVEYTYTEEAGVETAGFLASAYFPATDSQQDVTETYEYQVGSQDAFVVRVNGVLKSQHLLDGSGKTTQTSAEGEAFTLSYGQSTACDSSVACCSDASVTAVEDSARTAGDGLGSPSVVRTEHTLEQTTFSSGPRISSVSETCVGGQCGGFLDGVTRYAWTCDASDAPPKQLGVQDRRGNWTAYAYSAPSEPQPTNGLTLPDELRTAHLGAVDSSGTGALQSVSYTYAYAGAAQDPRAYEPRLQTEERVSLLGAAGAKARTTRLYDSASDRLLGEIRSGHTRVFNPSTSTWSVQERHIGTFYFTSHVCSGDALEDGLGRVLEVHGPCFVGSDQATDCPGTSFPVTQYTYYDAWGSRLLANRLRYVDAYPDAGTSCVGRPALRTEFTAYDVFGNPTEVVDPNGVLTQSTHEQFGVTSRTTANATVQYRYRDGRLASVRQPSGGYEVYCYRTGTPAGAGCTGGTPTNRLQWKARSAFEDGRTWSERVDYEFWPSGSRKKASYRAGCAGSTCSASDGELRRVERFAEDARGMPAWQQWGEGQGSFSKVRAFDGADNLTGVGQPFNGAPAWCGGLALDGTPLSALCSKLSYDRAHRVERVTQYPDLAPPGQHTLFTHDEHGNMTGVKTGCAEADDYVSCTQPASQYTHDDFGQLVVVQLPTMEGPVHRAYDALGNLALEETPSTRAAQEHIAFSYDGLGRLTLAEKVFTSGRMVLYRLGYDDSGTPPGSCTGLTPTEARTRGRLRYVQDSFGVTWYRYDSHGRVIEERRVRNASAGCDGQPNNNPSTLYTYTPDGHLASLQYPFGRQVQYEYGTGATAHRVSRVRVGLHDGTGWALQEVLSQILWEPYGGLRGYRMHHPASGTVSTLEYALGGDASTPGACGTTPPAMDSGHDYAGRVRALRLSAGSHGPGQGPGDIYQRHFQWQADQVVRTDTCLLGSTTAQTESFAFDGTLRLTQAWRPAGNLAAVGGAFESYTYGYDGRDNLTSLVGNGTNWVLTYAGAPQVDRLEAKTDSADGLLTERFMYDVDGRVSGKTLGQYLSGDAVHTLGLPHGQSRTVATDSVFRAASVNGAFYNYFYDSQGRRRRKAYPTGASDDFYHGLGRELLVDKGSDSLFEPESPINPATYFATDEYVWLDGRPVALVRGKLTTGHARLSDSSGVCRRNGEDAATCGFYFPVTDPLGKPVLMLDGAGRIAGTGEYQPSGHVNRVSQAASTPHPYPSGYSATLADFTQASVASGLAVRQRVLFHLVDTQSIDTGGAADDSLYLRDGAGGPVLYGPLHGVRRGRVVTPWVQAATGHVAITFAASSTSSNYTGAVVEGYEYQRYQVGAAPFWLPLRFPGQYHDAETDLFENWNRYYEPSIGRYLQPEPLAKSPAWLKLQAMRGVGAPSYGYAANNPINFVDPTGLDTQIIISYGPIGPYSNFGTHAAVRVDNGGDGKPVLMDWSGSYLIDKPEIRDQSGLFEGKAANLGPYLRYHAKTGDNVLVFNFPTTPEEERQIAERFGYNDPTGKGKNDPRGFECALSVSTHLSGIGPFKELSPTRFPGDLANQLRELMGVKVPRPCTDPLCGVDPELHPEWGGP